MVRIYTVTNAINFINDIGYTYKKHKDDIYFEINKNDAPTMLKLLKEYGHKCGYKRIKNNG